MPDPTPSTDPAALQQQAAENWEEAKKRPPLLAKLRAKYPGVYDDLDDKALAKKLVAKYPQYGADLQEYLQPEKPGVLRRAMQGVVTGAQKTGEALLAAPSAAAGALVGSMELPSKITEGIRAVHADPSGALKRGAESVGESAASLLPMRETATGVAKAVAQGDPSQLPPIEKVTEEATEFGLSQALPNVLAHGASKVGKFLISDVIPGTAPELHSLAIPHLEAVPERYRPTQSALDAAKADLATLGNPRVAMTNTQSAVQAMLRDELRMSNPDAGWMSTLENLRRTSQRGWDFDQLKLEAEDIGGQLKQIKERGGAKPTEGTRGAARARDADLRRLLAAIHADANAMKMEAPTYAFTGEVPTGMGQPTARALESTAVVPAQPTVRTAGEPDIEMQRVGTKDLGTVGEKWNAVSRLYRRDYAANALGRMIADNISVVGDQFDSINVNPIIRELRRAQRKQGYDSAAKLFVGSFEPGELNDIIDTLKQIGGKLPRIPPGRGVITGSSQVVLRAAIGEAVGMAAGHPGAGWLGGIIGAELLGQAMMTEPGRAIVRAVMKWDPHFGPAARNTVAAFLRSQITPDVEPDLKQPTPQQPQPAPAPQPSPTPQPTAFPAGQDEEAFQKWKGKYGSTGASEPELRATFQAGLAPNRQSGHWVDPDVLQQMREKPLGNVLDRWRQSNEAEKAQFRPILLARLLRGQLLPADRDQLRAALMPNSLPEEAPTH